jgi:hypothetical protein
MNTSLCVRDATECLRYWYLTAVPELLELVAERIDAAAEARP